jgi:hypothetical protein
LEEKGGLATGVNVQYSSDFEQCCRTFRTVFL